MKMNRFVESFGKFPIELEPYVGKEVEVDPLGLDPFKAKLLKGPVCYLADGDCISMQLYVGSPVVVKTADGKEFDFRELK